MNIKHLQALIPASFTYKYLDAEGVEKEELIKLQLNRMSFSQTASEDFRAAVDQVESDAGPISRSLANLIAEWNIDLDGAEWPPTADNIASCPPDFVGQLSETVFQRMSPNPPKAEPSPNGSAVTEKSTTAEAAAPTT